MTRKRYAQVGLGGRSRMYYRSLIHQYADTSEMVAVCDINEGRVNLVVEQAMLPTSSTG
jgi:predicted dehydrogenase